MRILGIETATSVCGVALVEDGDVRAEQWFEAERMHSEKLVGLLDRTLRSCTRTVSDLDAIAVSIGPGSFSGLRIGLSVAKGLACACDVPLVAVPTLTALAYRALKEERAGQNGLVLSLIDARRDEVYAAVYDENLVESTSARAVSIEGVATLLPQDERPVVVMGDGVEKLEAYHASCRDAGSMWKRMRIPARERRLCDAGSVALVGEQQFRRGDIADTASLEPLYVKEFYTTMKLQPTEVRH